MRIISPVSLESTMEMRPVQMIGVDPLPEAQVSMLETAVDSGSYFSIDSTELIVKGRDVEDLLDPGVLGAGIRGQGTLPGRAAVDRVLHKAPVPGCLCGVLVPEAEADTAGATEVKDG